MAEGNWFTSVEFEMPVRGPGLPAAEDAAAAVDGTAGAPGLQLGTVVQFVGDPEGQPRIQVRLPVLEDGNDIKALVTRSRHRLEFDDRNGVITVTTPARNRVVLNDRDRSIQLHDQHGNCVELHRSGIRLDTPGDLRIAAQGAVAIDAVGGVNIHSKGDMALTGLTVACLGQTAFSGKGGATAELSADGQTTIKGEMLMIN